MLRLLNIIHMMLHNRKIRYECAGLNQAKVEQRENQQLRLDEKRSEWSRMHLFLPARQGYRDQRSRC